MYENNFILKMHWNFKNAWNMFFYNENTLNVFAIIKNNFTKRSK